MDTRTYNGFSDAALSALADGENGFYVYCLTDLKKGKVLYVGYGSDNRIFEFEHFDAPTAKSVSKCRKLGRFLLNYRLSEAQAQAAAKSVAAFIRTVGGKKLKNHEDASAFGLSVEEWERRFGFSPAALDALNPEGLVLAVKLPGIVRQNLDPADLEQKIGGDWTVAKDLVKKVRYVVGIDTQAGNAVAGGFEVAGFEAVETEKNGKPYVLYRFTAKTDSSDALETLGLRQKSLPDLKFGNGSDKTYIRPKIA